MSSSTARFSNNIVKKKKPKKKYNIILDLDECILKTFYLREFGYWNRNKKAHFTQGPHIIRSVSYKYESENQNMLMFLRPYLEQFLYFLLENFNVGIWTSSYDSYAQAIVNDLEECFWKFSKKKLICFIYRVKSKTKITDKGGNKIDTNEFFDFINKTRFNLKFNGNIISKDLNFLFNHEKYKDKLNESNTILIDDSPPHYAMNRGKNVILVNEFNSMVYCDDILNQIQNWLTTNVLNKSKKKINFHKMNLPIYISSDPNHFSNKLNYNESRYLEDLSLGLVKKINRECNKKNKKKNTNSNSINSSKKSKKKMIKKYKSKTKKKI